MKIMACFDGSNVAEEVVRLAGVHAAAFGGEVWIVTSMAGGPEVARREFDARERELDYAKSLVEGKSPAVAAHLSIRGLSPGEDLVQLAREQGVGEIIIGVRRRSRVGKLVFGSTAQYVILNAPCPVVTVR
ncbi:MAG: universal stress protein [Desulfobacterales bacterium]|jgi:nucleotide-binding universal stress UspA family protein